MPNLVISENFKNVYGNLAILISFRDKWEFKSKTALYTKFKTSKVK